VAARSRRIQSRTVLAPPVKPRSRISRQSRTHCGSPRPSADVDSRHKHRPCCLRTAVANSAAVPLSTRRAPFPGPDPECGRSDFLTSLSRRGRLPRQNEPAVLPACPGCAADASLGVWVRRWKLADLLVPRVLDPGTPVLWQPLQQRGYPDGDS
jgi:hypothetical protein